MASELLTNKLKFPRLLSVILVLGSFIGITFVMIIWILPMLLNQMINLFSDLPHMFNTFNDWLLSLPENYPEVVDYQMLENLLSTFKSKI